MPLEIELFILFGYWINNYIAYMNNLDFYFNISAVVSYNTAVYWGEVTRSHLSYIWFIFKVVMPYFIGEKLLILVFYLVELISSFIPILLGFLIVIWYQSIFHSSLFWLFHVPLFYMFFLWYSMTWLSKILVFNTLGYKILLPLWVFLFELFYEWHPGRLILNKFPFLRMNF